MSKFYTQNYSILLKKSNSSFNTRLVKVYERIDFLSAEYSNLKEWFFLKVVPGVNVGTRTIITKLDHNNLIVALAILKHDSVEKKICTLWVDSRYQSLGLGSELIEESISLLQTNYPLITVSETRARVFERIFDKYNFKLHSEYPSYYNNGISEFSFNESIEKTIILEDSSTAIYLSRDVNILINNAYG